MSNQLLQKATQIAAKQRKEYSELSDEERKRFTQFHAPFKLKKPNEVLVLEIVPNSARAQGRTIRTMPSKQDMLKHEVYYDTNNVERKKRLTARYKTVTNTQIASFLHKRTFDDQRGIFVDHTGKAYHDIFMQGHNFYKIVEDVKQEAEFLKELLALENPAPLKEAALPKVEKESEKAEEPKEDAEEAAYWTAAAKEFNDNPKKWTKKEFAKKHGVSPATLNKKLEQYG